MLHSAKLRNLAPRLDNHVITNLLKGIHTAVAVEALRLAEELEVDAKILREIVRDAAGYSVMFEKVAEQLEGKSSISLKDLDFNESVSAGLVSPGRTLHGSG